MSVAEVGEVVGLGAGLQRRGFGFHEIADPARPRPAGSGPQPRIGTDGSAPPIDACTTWENAWITAPSAIETPGPITTNGSIVTSLPNAVSVAR